MQLSSLRLLLTNVGVDRIFAGCLLPVPALIALFANPVMRWEVFALASLALFVLPMLLARVGDSVRDLGNGFCAASHPILVTAALAGHPWQIDAHMLFFVALAVVATGAKPRVLLFASALVALHHLSFSFFAPALVFPAADLVANLARTVVHGGIVVLEVAVLLVSIGQRRTAHAEAEHQKKAAQDKARTASAAEAQATEERRAAEQIVSVFDARFAELVAGRLDCEIHDPLPAQYDGLRRNFNVTVETLRRMIGDVMAVTGNIKRGADEISAASGDLSHRTETQAATLEETAAALEELTRSVTSAADSARDVETAMDAARRDAEDSRGTVTASVEAMTLIEEFSSRIDGMIGVIDDIAFQTSLLALNAGVEAARAGEAGQGFAVVAAEVRTLAQRSATSAAEIKSLISESRDQIEEGVGLVRRSGEAMRRVVDRFGQVAEEMSGIAQGAADQATALNEVNAAVSQLDHVTQKNAAMVEEVTAAGHALNAEADNLSGLVTRFRTGDPVTVRREAAA